MRNTIATIAGALCILRPQIVHDWSKSMYIVLKTPPWSNFTKTEYVIMPAIEGTGDRNQQGFHRSHDYPYNHPAAHASVLSRHKLYPLLIEGLWVSANRPDTTTTVESPWMKLSGDKPRWEEEVGNAKESTIEPLSKARKKRLQQWAAQTVTSQVENYGITQAGAQKLIITLFDLLVDDVQTDELGSVNVHIKMITPGLQDSIQEEIRSSLATYAMKTDPESPDSSTTKKKNFRDTMKGLATSIVTTVDPGIETKQMNKLVETLMSWVIGWRDRKSWNYVLWIGKGTVSRNEMMLYLSDIVTTPLLEQLRKKSPKPDKEEKGD